MLTTAVAAAASVAVVSTPALVASRSRSYTVGSCRAQGDYAICDASGTANHPATIRVHVSVLTTRWHPAERAVNRDRP